MTAFAAFLRANAVWIYLLCAVGILIGIKILVDARRLARITLFSLEQERAGEQTFRAIALIVLMVVAAATVAIANSILWQVVPSQEAVILRGPTPTSIALVFPTNTLVPSPTPTFRPTETVFATGTPNPPTTTRAPVAKSTAVPTPPPTSAFPFPAPELDPKGPVWNGVVMIGVNQAGVNLRFQWIWNCPQCRLGPEDRFVVMVSYVDRESGAFKTVGGGTQGNYLTMADISRGAGMELWHRAKEDAYQWSVQVKRGEQALSPPSATWSFVWH